MGELRFRIPILKESAPEEWFHFWAAKYGEDDEYAYLISKYDSFSAEDVVRIAKWKDGVQTDGRWKPNVASVAFLIWMQAAEELQKCPGKDQVKAFLHDWSNRTYTDVFATRQVKKRFGLSRATTLLHFLSGGVFPIADKRVRVAVGRLLGSPVPEDTVDWYLDELCPFLEELSALCNAGNSRALDNALFSYGAFEIRTWETNR